MSLAVCLKGCGLCMQVSDEKPCDFYSPWDTSSIAVDSEFVDFQVFQVLTRKCCTFLESEELPLVELPFFCSCLCGYMFNLAFLANL